MFAPRTNPPKRIAIPRVVQRIHTSEVTSALGPAHDLASLPRYRRSVSPVASGVSDVFSGLTRRIPQVGLQRVIADAERLTRLSLVLAAPLEHQPNIPAAPGPQRFLALHGRKKNVAVQVTEPERKILEFDDAAARQR